MTIYLPIAELSLNLFVLLAIGGAVGMLTGIFGIGGGFLLTPLLIFLGIPSAVAVSSGLNQIVASSVSGVMGHWHRGNVDIKMGLILLLGGLLGSGTGVIIFSYLQSLGQIDVFIRIAYVLFLSTIGGLMLFESLNSMRRQKKIGNTSRVKLHHHNWAHGLPFRMRFHKSGLYISILPPIFIGFGVGLLTAIMGIGGGFILIPLMIYVLGMPTLMVIGTSLFQMVFVSAFATFLQASYNQTVDVTLAMVLLIGGVVGAQIGARIATRLRGENLRLFLAAIILFVGIVLLITLVIPPDDPFLLEEINRFSPIMKS